MHTAPKSKPVYKKLKVSRMLSSIVRNTKKQPSAAPLSNNLLF